VGLNLCESRSQTERGVIVNNVLHTCETCDRVQYFVPGTRTKCKNCGEGPLVRVLEQNIVKVLLHWLFPPDRPYAWIDRPIREDRDEVRRAA
jgi:hypothetical protein